MQHYTIKKKPRKAVAMARVIRDPRNAKRDYYIPLDEAIERYRAGKLKKDATNQCFTE